MWPLDFLWPKERRWACHLPASGLTPVPTSEKDAALIFTPKRSTWNSPLGKCPQSTEDIMGRVLHHTHKKYGYQGYQGPFANALLAASVILTTACFTFLSQVTNISSDIRIVLSFLFPKQVSVPHQPLRVSITILAEDQPSLELILFRRGNRWWR